MVWGIEGVGTRVWGTGVCGIQSTWCPSPLPPMIPDSRPGRSQGRSSRGGEGGVGEQTLHLRGPGVGKDGFLIAKSSQAQNPLPQPGAGTGRDRETHFGAGVLALRIIKRLRINLRPFILSISLLRVRGNVIYFFSPYFCPKRQHGSQQG